LKMFLFYIMLYLSITYSFAFNLIHHAKFLSHTSLQSLTNSDFEQIRNIMKEEIVLSEERTQRLLNKNVETLSRKISDLSEESVREKVAELNGVLWAESYLIESVEDIVTFIYPLIQQMQATTTSKVDSESDSALKLKYSILLAQELQPFLVQYMGKVTDHLRNYARESQDDKLFNILSNVEQDDSCKLLGTLIGAVKNETWRRKLIRLKEACHLINKKDPSDDELAALTSTSGPGVLLACGVAQASKTSSIKQHFGNPFQNLSDPFIELNDEIEVDHGGKCTFLDGVAHISVGEMKSSSAGIQEARKQIARALTVYEWAFQTIATTQWHKRYQFVMEGNIFIPKVAKRGQDKMIFVDSK